MRSRATLLIASLAALVLVLSACQRGGVSSDDAALIRQQLEDVANRLDVVEDRIEDLADDATGSEMLISQVRRELNQARNTLADVDDKLAATDGSDLTDDGLGAPLDDFSDGVTDTMEGVGDSLDQFGDDLDRRIDDLQDNMNDGLNDDGFGDPVDPAPANPGTGGGPDNAVPGIPAL